MTTKEIKLAINNKLDSIFTDAVNMSCPAKCVLVDRQMCYLTWPEEADRVVSPELFGIMVAIIDNNFSGVEIVDSPKYRASKKRMEEPEETIDDLLRKSFHLN